MTVGERLKRYRELASLSQNELAKRSGVPRPTISVLEKGVQIDITLTNARRLARALKITIDELAGEGDHGESLPTESVGVSD